MKWISIFIWLFFWAAMLFSQPAQTSGDLFKAGVAAYQQGNYDLSYKCLSQAIGMDATRHYFYYNRGITAEAMGNNSQASADFNKSLELKSTAEAYYQLGMLAYKKNNWSEAQIQFEKARDIREDVGGMNFFLGLIYFRDKKYDQAYQAFKTCTDHNKGNNEAYYYRAYCAAELGMKPEAIESLKSAVINNSKDWKYFMKMYELYNVLDDKGSALQNMSMVIELGEHKPEYYTTRAKLYRALGQDFLAEQDEKTIETLGTSALSTETDK